MSQGKRIRFLLAKTGLDGHDRGAKVVARILRDAGIEVIYTGLHQTPESIAEAAQQEDVHVVGVSILSGAHMVHIPRLVTAMKERGMNDVPVVVGGIIPKSDTELLRRLGVAAVFGAGTRSEEIIARVRELAGAS